MSSKFRKHIANPKNASKLTDKVLLNEKKGGGFDIEVNNKKVTIHQIGVAKS